MALELNKISPQVQQMGRRLAERWRDQEELLVRAQAELAAQGQAGEELLAKIRHASAQDSSWRGAEPVGERLDGRYGQSPCGADVTLIAVDGSQIYPDRHGVASYYLLNTGSIVLRRGSSDAPSVCTTPAIYFEESDLYDEQGRMRDTEYINRQRDALEIGALATLAYTERAAAGGDLARPILAMSDGPLLMWAREQTFQDARNETVKHLHHVAEQLDALKRAHAIPVGYVDRPSSAFVLRTIEVGRCTMEEMTRERLRKGEFRPLPDRLLFRGLAPGERTDLFASTSVTNLHYAGLGHRILFFYMNVARPGSDQTCVVRVELPEWAASPEDLAIVQSAVYDNCALTGFPYVLARAHELAVVGTAERSDFEAMVERELLRCGLRPTISDKAHLKALMHPRRRN